MNRTAPQLDATVSTFTQLLSSTRRGTRLARLLTVTELHAWDAPPELTERAESVVAELAANAVAHGRLPGRGFRLTLTYRPTPGLLRIEVTDARGDLLPQTATPPTDAASLNSGGRGLALVAALADRWDTVPYPPSGKTVGADPRTRAAQPTESSSTDSANR
ncbi:ATP-binding protein [Streptomyces sp. NBC_01304]|uniref:ATP-binding protein n=1 Tax=Streptomyces sp. NBC_01304 TaxID=2903818 RepID=UPI002E164D97|nr:ATP-binding protein [Streptomyces sp. NBC_01304]